MQIDDVKGVIFNIQHYSIHAGPVIRTTVFLTEVAGHLGDRHGLTQLIDIACQSPGNPQIRIHKRSRRETSVFPQT